MIRENDEMREKLDAALRETPGIDAFETAKIEGRADYRVNVWYTGQGRVLCHFAVTAATIEANHPYALQEIIRNELPGDFPDDTSPRRQWQYAVLQAMGCTEEYRDKPWIAITAAAILNAEERMHSIS